MPDALTVRAIHPVRSAVSARTKYGLYRADLRRDFGEACGYCGDEDARVDRIGFHIDHFAPLKLFAELECVYGNLVYACRFCNMSKSDHWVGTDAAVHNDGTRGFVDPCSKEYETHFRREQSGRITPVTALGSYIGRRLRLGMLRHELLWRARRERALRKEADELIDELETRDGGGEMLLELLRRYRALTKAIEDYEFRAVA